MRHFAWVVLALCCAAPAGAEEVQIFTPSSQGDAPVYMNGQVVRIDRAAGTITLLGDGGHRVLNVDRQTLASLTGLRPGANVILGVRVSGTGAAQRSVVTDVRTSSGAALSGARVSASGRVSQNASAVTAGERQLGTARVVSTDVSERRLTVIDSTGATRVLDVRGTALTSLGTLRAGDTISLGVAAPLVNGTPAGTVTTIGTGAGAISGSNGKARSIGTASGGAPSQSNPGTFTNDSLPQTPGLPASPNDGINRNPAATKVQPVPGAQPVPGVQGPTGVQPVPGAQSLPGTGVTGQTTANPGLATQPVPGTGGQTANNAGATGGAAVGGGTNAVPQLGNSSIGGINSQIPSIPPSTGATSSAVLPLPSVMPGTNPPRTPQEVAAVRELSSRDFDMAVAVVAARAAEVDRAWVAYRSTCVTSTTPLNNRSREWFGVLDGSIIGPTDDDCEASYNEVARLAQGLEDTLGNAKDAARQGDVLPGRMREILQRYNLDL